MLTGTASGNERYAKLFGGVLTQPPLSLGELEDKRKATQLAWSRVAVIRLTELVTCGKTGDPECG